MRQGIMGLVSGLVIGSVLAGGAAFALDAGHPATRGVPATPKVQAASNRWQSSTATHSVDATKPAGIPAAKPQAPKAPAKARVAAKHTHSGTCVHNVGSDQHHTTAPTPARGTVAAVPETHDRHMGSHDGGSRHD